MSTAWNHVQLLATLAEQDKEERGQDVTDKLLGALSRNSWKDDRSFLTELLHHPDLIMKLCMSHDIFVRFTLQRLVSSMLCLNAVVGDQSNGLLKLQVDLIDRFIATLKETSDRLDTTKAIETSQLLLEIFHNVLKDARKQLKTIQTATKSQYDNAQAGQLQHVGLALQERVQSTCRAMSLLVVQWLRTPQLQHPTLMFMIDIEKNARLSHSLHGADALTHHPCLTSLCMDQLLSLSRFEPTCLRRVLQLLFIHLQLPYTKEATTSRRDHHHQTQNDHRTNAEDNVKILQSLVPYAVRLRECLVSPESKHRLRQSIISGSNTTTTTYFVALQATQILSDQERRNDPYFYFVQCTLQDPEILRGLVRVFCQSALNGLRGMLTAATTSNTTPKPTINAHDNHDDWSQVFDKYIDSILDVCWHRDWAPAAYTLINFWQHVHEEEDEDSSDETIDNSRERGDDASKDGGMLFWKAAFHLFGEDDADVAWLLHTSFELIRNLEWLVGQLRQSTITTASLSSSSLSPSSPSSLLLPGGSLDSKPKRRVVSYKTQSRFIELLLFLQKGRSLQTSVDSKPSRHIFYGIHPLDGYFYFLHTIGYDPQTVIDLLLSMDHKEIGGLLAVTVSLFRHYIDCSSATTTSSSPSSSTSTLSNRELLFDHWRSICTASWQQKDDDDSDDVNVDDGNYEFKVDQITQAAQRLFLHNSTTLGDSSSFSSHHEQVEAESEEDQMEEEMENWKTILPQAHFCLDEVLSKLQALERQDLLPFNPQVLLHVLQGFTIILDTFLAPQEKK